MTPDVVVDFTSLALTEPAADVVRVTEPAVVRRPDRYKVSIALPRPATPARRRW
ncbi:MAG: hypothetical protein U0736_15395 [Gemmataceae bacterium]